MILDFCWKRQGDKPIQITRGCLCTWLQRANQLFQSFKPSYVPEVKLSTRFVYRRIGSFSETSLILLAETHLASHQKDATSNLSHLITNKCLQKRQFSKRKNVVWMAVAKNNVLRVARADKLRKCKPTSAQSSEMFSLWTKRIFHRKNSFWKKNYKVSVQWKKNTLDGKNSNLRRWAPSNNF